MQLYFKELLFCSCFDGLFLQAPPLLLLIFPHVRAAPASALRVPICDSNSWSRTRVPNTKKQCQKSNSRSKHGGSPAPRVKLIRRVDRNLPKRHQAPSQTFAHIHKVISRSPRPHRRPRQGQGGARTPLNAAPYAAPSDLCYNF